MAFSSFTFIFCFLPLFLIAYSLSPKRLKNFVVLIASYLFYAWGAPKIVPLLLLSSVLDYLFSQRFESRYRRTLFGIAVGLNVLQLFYFKYSNFFIGEFNQLLSGLGFEAMSWSYVALPIGISFFTFQKISYLADVYSSRVQPATHVFDYLLYVVLFPQLIAGPIIRYHDIADQIKSREQSAAKLWSGMFRFCLGFGKKVLIADELGKTVAVLFEMDPSSLNSSYALLGVLCYSFQIYFDFSGYSDMAIGLGRMMGFEFPENFNMPYISQSITEFWRRWHISLSNWMKEYLYIPLGGNRLGPTRTYANLWIVFLLSGLWHGANWTFLFWGFYHGLFLVFDRLFWLRASASLPRVLRVAVTFFAVMVGWVFFRCETITQAFAYLQALFSIHTFGEGIPAQYLANIMLPRGQFVFVLACVICIAPLFAPLEPLARRTWVSSPRPLRLSLEFVSALFLLVSSALVIGSGSFSPFLYFRF